MMINLTLVTEVWPMILAFTAFALIARPIACSLALTLVGTPPADARRSSLLLTPLGEFSFIIAQLGISSAILPETFYPIAAGASILTILATPLMNRHRDAILGAAARIEPRWVRRTLEAYHAWFVQLGERPARAPLWGMLKPRFGLIAIEILLISGLLIFSEALLAWIASASLGARIEPTTLAYSFWGVVTILVLVPLVAIWRNGGALAMLLAEAWESNWLPRIVIERVLKGTILIGLASWLYLILPLATFTKWGWAVIAVGAAMIVAVFSRRLIYWHSQWQTSVQEVLADDARSPRERREQARASLGESLGDWAVVLADCLVPDAAPYAGKTLADLAIRARFGCSIIEVTRNGHSISAPAASFAIFPGDALLILGEPGHISAARAFLESRSDARTAEEAADGGVLDTCRVTTRRAGNTLAELQVAPRTGVRIVGIQRGDERLINPGADERLRDGDDLLVFGTLPKIRQFRHWLVSGPDGNPGPVSTDARTASRSGD
ncbi:MAG: TrkA C-terminal domain-containing protein, partial [Opitutaceae bacterium]